MGEVDNDPLGSFLRGTDWKEKVGSRIRLVRTKLFVDNARFFIILQGCLVTAMEELSVFFFNTKHRSGGT